MINRFFYWTDTLEPAWVALVVFFSVVLLASILIIFVGVAFIWLTSGWGLWLIGMAFLAITTVAWVKAINFTRGDKND